jgi:3-hydroxyisobutyrate dehydrogenase
MEKGKDLPLKTIGWIGTGVMGNSMCGHILKAGYPVIVYNRTKDKTNELLSKGAKWLNNPKAIANASDIVISIVGYPKDVEEVYLGPQGLLAGARPGTILIDMTTSEPALAERLYQAGKEKNISILDAPVSGGDVGAKNATLAIMIGGDKEIFEKVLPIFKIMGQNIAYMGKAGAGQHTKMVNQINIASTMVGLVECMLYAQKAGLNQQEVIDVIGKGAAATWSLNNYGPRIVKGNFDPGFFIKHFVKDMGIALQEARRMNLSLPGLALANQFYLAAMAMGLENLGTHGLYKVLARLNGLEK